MHSYVAMHILYYHNRDGPRFEPSGLQRQKFLSLLGFCRLYRFIHILLLAYLFTYIYICIYMRLRAVGSNPVRATTTFSASLMIILYIYYIPISPTLWLPLLIYSFIYYWATVEGINAEIVSGRIAVRSR